MTDRGVASLLASNVKLGANVSIAAGPVGGGVAAETANLSADILSFSRSQGLFGGVSVDGAVVAGRADPFPPSAASSRGGCRAAKIRALGSRRKTVVPEKSTFFITY